MRVVDDRLAQLQTALTGLGFPALTTPADASVLDEIAAAVAPFRLPADVWRLWELLDPRSLPPNFNGIPGGPWPHLTEPRFALDTWLLHQGMSGPRVPRVLFPLCYTSWVLLSVELEGPDGAGGDIFYWSLDGDRFELRFRSVRDWLDAFVRLIDEGAYDHRDKQISFDSDRFDELAALRLAELPPHPIYGRTTTFSDDPREWPDHWLAAVGYSHADWQPRGATHTIAEFRAAHATGTARATIQADVGWFRDSEAGRLVTVSDDTGELSVFCPAHTTLFGPWTGARFEFDIVEKRALENQKPVDARAEAVRPV